MSLMGVRLPHSGGAQLVSGHDVTDTNPGHTILRPETVPVSVSWGGRNKLPLTGRLKQQKCIFSWFRGQRSKIKVLQGHTPPPKGSRGGSFQLLPASGGLQALGGSPACAPDLSSLFSLHHHTASLCLCFSLLSLIRILIIRLWVHRVIQDDPILRPLT